MGELPAVGRFKKPMHLAVVYGDVEAIVALKKSRVRINGLENGLTPLHLAVVNDDAVMVKKLISLGANLSKLNIEGYTPLQLAVVLNHISLFRYLIDGDSELDIDTFSKEGNTALHIAVIKGNAEAVTVLLELGADADLPNKQGHAPLHIAIILGKPDVIDAVLEYADKPNILDVTESRPLHLAVMHNLTNAIPKIGELENTKVDYLNGFGDSPLHLAAKLGNPEAIVELYNLGANMNLKNSKGHAAIHIAVIYNKLSAVETLVQCGAHINHADRGRNTPVHWAVTQNNILALKLLIRLWANINAKNALGDSPLHSAILANYKEALRVLLHFGADFNSLNARGMPPLHVAVCLGNKDVIEMLFHYGANVHCLDVNLDSPLHSAAKYCNLIGILTVIKHGANFNSKNKDGFTALDIVLSYVRGKKFKTAVKTLTDLYRKINLKRKSPLCTQEILKSAKVIVKYEILKNLQDSKLNEPEYVSGVIPILQSYITDSFAEVKLMKSTLLHKNLPLYSFVMSGWVAKMPLTCTYTSEVVLDHVLDVATTKGYPVYRDIISSKLERPALLKKVLHLRMYARHNGKTTFLDFDTVPIIIEHLSIYDILNLLIAYSNRDQDVIISNSSNGNKRKLADIQLDSNSVNKKHSLISKTPVFKKAQFPLFMKISEKFPRSSLANTSEKVSSSINTRSKKALSSETTSRKKVQVPEIKSSKCSIKTGKVNSIFVLTESPKTKRNSSKTKTTKGKHSPSATKVTKKNYSSSTVKVTKEKHSALTTRSKKRSLNSKATGQKSSESKNKKSKK